MTKVTESGDTADLELESLELDVNTLQRNQEEDRNEFQTNMFLYMLLFFQLPKGVLQRLDYLRSRFFSQGDGEKK